VWTWRQSKLTRGCYQRVARLGSHQAAGRIGVAAPGQDIIHAAAKVEHVDENATSVCRHGNILLN
jgi:hypothetical protein